MKSQTNKTEQLGILPAMHAGMHDPNETKETQYVLLRVFERPRHDNAGGNA